MKNGKFAKRGVATKTMVLVLAVMLVVGATIGGTIAWLTAESATVTNTFTYGDINIDLWENELVEGKLTDEKVTSQDVYKVIPGGTEAKNPTLTVKKGSEECYVYVTVENNLLLDDGTVAATVNVADTWTVVDANGNKTLYRYNTTVNVLDAAEDLDLPVFTEVSYDGEVITKTNIAQLGGDTIVINGYAHQAANTDQATADAAAIDWAF